MTGQVKRFAVFAIAVLACAQDAPKTGSISGVVLESGTRQPVANASVGAGLAQQRRVSSTTDLQGRFTLRDVPPGRLSIAAQPAFIQGQGFPGQTTRIVNLSPGQEIESLEILIPRNAMVSGKVVDQNDEPVPSQPVILVSREYQLGQLRYIYSSVVNSDDEGEYSFPSVTPGRAYILMTLRFVQQAKAISDAPLDPGARRPAYAPTYYPGIPTIEGAQTIALAGGEHRENMNLRVERLPSHCAQGTARLDGSPGVTRIRYYPSSPHSGNSGNGGLYMGGNSVLTGSDGRFRICDLAPGTYSLIAGTPNNSRGSMEFTIKDQDVALELYSSANIEVPGELTWAEAPPEGYKLDAPANWFLRFVMVSASERGQAKLTGMGPFTISPMPMEDFWTELDLLPADVYIKELSYAGHDLIYEPFRPGTAVGKDSVQIVLGRNGGKVQAKVSDSEDKPLADHFITMVPVGVRNETQFADAAASTLYNGRAPTQRQTDQNGEWTSPMLAPGKYYVYAAREPFDRTPETVNRYWQGRAKAVQVELTPGGTEEARIVPLN